jgi:platelet-activating factor acetylhydrolase
MIFSHGLGGTRNAYSHLVGSIASHGVIVIAPEHRDGSTPISYIRAVPSPDGGSENGQEKPGSRSGSRTVKYQRLSHTPTPEVEEARNAQLRIRLWELGLIHDSLLKIDNKASPLTNLNTSSTPLSMFASKMDIHTPGSITFAGHSFGAATVVQFLKSTFYSPINATAPSSYTPLFAPSSRSPTVAQITPNTPVMLLDCWCMPLRASSTRWLWDRPLPSYAPSGAGGSAILAVESQAFFKWRVHLKATKRLLSPDPTAETHDYQGRAEPWFYYAEGAAHLSQSDFGMLFPWVVRRVFGTREGERVMRLNVRAGLELMRGRGVVVGETSPGDMEFDEGEGGKEGRGDEKIFGKEGIRGWHWLSTDLEEMGDVDEDEAMKGREKGDAGPGDAILKNEVLPGRTGTVENL